MNDVVPSAEQVLIREVFGTTATPAVREALGAFGVERFVPTEDGFRCFRTIEDTDQKRIEQCLASAIQPARKGLISGAIESLAGTV